MSTRIQKNVECASMIYRSLASSQKAICELLKHPKRMAARQPVRTPVNFSKITNNQCDTFKHNCVKLWYRIICKVLYTRTFGA